MATVTTTASVGSTISDILLVTLGVAIAVTVVLLYQRRAGFTRDNLTCRIAVLKSGRSGNPAGATRREALEYSANAARGHVAQQDRATAS